MDALIVAIVFWGFCGLIAGTILESRGYSSCSGFAFGVLFGPLGILIAAVVPPTQESVQEKQQQIEYERLRQGELKKCPYCAEFIKREARVCRFCGKEQPAQAPRRLPKAPVLPTPLPSQEAKPQTSQASQKSPSASHSNFVIYVVLLLFVVALACTLLVGAYVVVISPRMQTMPLLREPLVSTEYASNPTPNLPTPRPPSPTPTSTPTPYPPVARGKSGVWNGNGQQLKFTLVDFSRGTDAASRITRTSVYNPAPPSGTEYLLFRVRVDFVSGNNIANLLSSDFVVVDSKNQEYTFGSGMKIIPVSPPLFDKQSISIVDADTREMKPGSSAEGWMAFVVTANAPSPMLVFGHPLSDYEARITLDTR